MKRHINILIAGAALAGTLTAGQITIGGSSGLTLAYVNGTSSCTGASIYGNTGFSGCAAGTPSLTANNLANSFDEGNYDNAIFNGAQNASTSPTPFALYSTSTATPVGQKITDSAVQQDGTSGVVFSMIAGDTVGSTSANSWYASGQGKSGPPETMSITIPVGVLSVDQVSTMLNNEFGVNGKQETSVAFTFGNSSTGGSTSTVTVYLVNGDQIGSVINCTTPGTGTCNTFGVATPISTPQTLTSTPLGDGSYETGATNVKITTNQLYSFAYNTSFGGAAYGTSTGNVLLDDQTFYFGNQFNGQFLQSITVSENNTTYGGENQISRTALTAITVDSTQANATPEPASFVLIFGGLTAAGLIRRRRKV